MSTVQMNVRIDAKTKAHGDAVFARSGFTPSQVVRAVWEYAGRTGTLPPCMQQGASDQQDKLVQQRVRDGFGLALTLAGAQVLTWRRRQRASRRNVARDTRRRV